MDQHIADLCQASQIYFIYHPRRSSVELEYVLELASAQGTVPVRHSKNPKVFLMTGSAFEDVLKKKGPQCDLVQTMLSRAELVKIVAPLGAGGVCLWIPKSGLPLQLALSAFTITHTGDAVDDHFPDAERYLKEVRKALADGVAKKKDMRPQRLFTELDRNTAADLIDELSTEKPKPKFTAEEIANRKSSLGLMRDLLENRLTRRSRDEPAGAPRVEGMKSDLDWLAKQFMDVLLDESCYPEAVDGDPSFETAIEGFSTGGLRMQLEPSMIWACQPNSAYYFLFGEFALCLYQMVADGSLSDKRWTPDLALRLANVTVRTQPLYAHAYGVRAQALPAGSNPSVDDYRSYDYRQERSQEAAAQLAAKRDEFKNRDFKDLCELSAQHVRDHLPGWKS